jgi:hypothetical protein
VPVPTADANLDLIDDQGCENVADAHARECP